MARRCTLFKILSVFAILLSCLSLSVKAQPAPPIAFASRTVLIGAEGALVGRIKLIDMGPGKMGWIQAWDNGSSVAWKTTVERTSDYRIASILESGGENCNILLMLDERTLRTDCGDKGWKRINIGTLHLTAGQHTLTLSSVGATPLAKFFSLEFVRPQVEAHLAAEGREQMADTSWMTAAGYGLMFHWTSQTLPQQGPPQSYCDAVRSFDVERFANTVEGMGAGFVVFTTSHAGFYFPGPNPVIDRILPGRTCPRDLVGDLADALNRRNIHLELYFHPGHDDAPWWQRTHFDDSNKTAYFEQWRSIIAQIGRQYGKRLAGFWFDDAAFTYYPFNPSWQQMTAAARTGNPQRVIAYNSWILPKLNDFYDVFAGENAFWEPQYEELDYLPIGGTGRYTGGPQQGLQAELTALIEDDWGHFKRDAPIVSPRMTADALIPKLKDALSRKMVPLLDVEVYQDGSISPQTLQLFNAIRAEIKPSNAPRKNADSFAINPNAVNILKANLAKRSPSTAESKPKGMWIQGWNDAQQSFHWSIESPQAGEYSVDVLVSGSPGARIEIAGPSNKISVEIPQGNDHWGNNWNKIAVPGWLVLPKGVAAITVQSSNPAGIATNKNAYEGMALLSLELVEQKEKAALSERILKARSTAKWLADAQYGLMFQWGQWGFPEHGESKPWPKMIDDFNVEKFADMVQSTGAGYVIWSATWRTYYFSAPIQAIDRILPGRTSKRDLIGELADALNKRGIKLMLYYHCGYGDREWQARNFSTTDPDKIGTDALFRKNWISIITEVGERYGNRLAGWFIDEGWYPSPFEEQNRALKAGYPGRIVSFNDWVRPRLTDFQDVEFGEAFNGLNDGAGILFPDGPPLGGDGVYVQGLHKGLQSHGMFILDGAGYGPEWGIWRPDTTIAKPMFTSEQIVNMAKYAKAHHVALSFNLLMYEDGTVSPDSLEALRLFGNTVRGE